MPGEPVVHHGDRYQFDGVRVRLEYVRARGCDLAQGFLLARPMPIADAEAYIFGGAEVAVRPVAMKA